MKKTLRILAPLFAIGYMALAQSPEQTKPVAPVAFWSFEQLLGGRVVAEPTARIHDPIEGFPTLAEGVVGNALKLDGLATRLTRPADKAPVLGEAFSFEGWIALQ